VAGRIRSIEKSNDIGNRTRDLLACSIVPQPPTLLHAPKYNVAVRKELLVTVAAIILML
jgi:hypothetical protein